MKSFRSALLLMVCLAFAGNLPAEARPASHSGTSSSFKSGFSSQKSNSSAHRKSSPPANRQSGPGAFGQQAGSPAQPQRNSSALSRDVDQGAARDNALRTLDQRRNAANNQPLPPLNDSLRQRQPASPGYRGAPYPPPPGPVYQQPSSGNGLMAGLMGFMLGRAMSQSHQPVAYPTANGQQQPAAVGPEGGAMVAGMPGLGQPAPAVAPQPSFFMSVLRWFAWLFLLSVLVWTSVYAVRKFRRLRATPNYSFERN